MKIKIVDITPAENEAIKVSVSISGNFADGDYPFGYYFRIINKKIKTVKIIYTGK